MNELIEYDYVIVGAGSARSVLANRMTEDGKYSVPLLEAGGSDLNFWIHLPIGYGKIFYDEKVNWKHLTESEPNLDGNQVYWPRGKVLGGSSSINAMVYVRGHSGDYDDWSTVAPGWAWQDVAPFFRRMEDWQGGADNHRGSGGPLHVHDVSSDVHPLTRTYLEAAEQAGLPINPDYIGAEMEGQIAIRSQPKTGCGHHPHAAILNRPAGGLI